MLLYRLQNVNISSDGSSSNEFWHIREMFQENSTENTNQSISDRFVVSSIVNSEQELYVKGNTAAWSKGINGDQQQHQLPVTCFTCDTPIKHAFFCPPEFYADENLEKDSQPKRNSEQKEKPRKQADIGICLIDATTIRVYAPTGEDFRTSLEFPVSNVWQTKLGLLLERDESKEIVDREIISMPRLFSISHSFNELCPVLLKSNNGAVHFLTESDYRVVFANAQNDIVMLYDNRVNRHFLARIRPATSEEKQIIGGNNIQSWHFTGIIKHSYFYLDSFNGRKR